LLDEPTNHLDLDSKDVLLEALEDFGGTLIFVSHDRYFVDRLATKVIEVGHGGIEVYPGTYEQFLWSRAARRTASGPAAAPGKPDHQPADERGTGRPVSAATGQTPARRHKPPTYAEKKRQDAEERRRRRADADRARQLSDLENRIAQRERRVKELEAQMAQPGFYDAREPAEQVVAEHQRLMWEVGDLMHQWESLQTPTLTDEPA